MDENDIVVQFQRALQAINSARPNGGQLSPEQAQLNQMKIDTASNLVNNPPQQNLTGSEQFMSMLKGLSGGIASRPAAADNYGSLLGGVGAGLVQGAAGIQDQNLGRKRQNLEDQQKASQLLNQVNLDQPTVDIGNAANMANTIVASKQREKALESQERIAKAKFDAQLKKAEAKGKNVGLADVLKVKDRYDKETESFNKTRNFKSIVDAAKADPTGMKAVGAVYAFLKAIDEGSVVRPSELDLASGSVSTLTSLGNQFKKTYEDGRPVAPEVVKQVADAMDVYFNAAAKRQGEINKKFGDFSSRYNIPAEDVVTVQGDMIAPVSTPKSSDKMQRFLELQKKFEGK